MKTSAIKLAILGTIAGLPAIGLTQTGGNANESIQLRIANRACNDIAANSISNPNPSDLNDGDLDDAESAAIEEGCAFRATVSAPNGMRTPGVNLVLRRSVSPNGRFETFGYPRTTDEQGNAVWRFQPTANTDYIYEVVSSTPSGTSATSNKIEIQLCTGDDSVGAVSGAPTEDAGQGCENRTDDNDDNGDDNNFPDDINPINP
jgi:hypothetical protein